MAFVDADDEKGSQFSVRVDLVGLWFAERLEGNLTLLRFTKDGLLAGKAVRRALIILAE